jgi:hypothetical protein
MRSVYVEDQKAKVQTVEVQNTKVQTIGKTVSINSEKAKGQPGTISTWKTVMESFSIMTHKLLMTENANVFRVLTIQSEERK